MKKILPIVLIIALGNLNAQQIQRPKKDCLGASAKPDGLTSWCEEPYYNECECNFESAYKAYEEEVKETKDEIDNLIDRFKLVRIEAQSNYIKEAEEIKLRLRLQKGDFKSDKRKAISLFQNAIQETRSSIELLDEIERLHSKIYSSEFPNTYERHALNDIQLWNKEVENLKSMEQPKNGEIKLSTLTATETSSNSTSTDLKSDQKNSIEEQRAQLMKEVFDETGKEYLNGIAQNSLTSNKYRSDIQQYRTEFSKYMNKVNILGEVRRIEDQSFEEYKRKKLSLVKIDAKDTEEILREYKNKQKKITQLHEERVDERQSEINDKYEKLKAESKDELESAVYQLANTIEQASLEKKMRQEREDMEYELERERNKKLDKLKEDLIKRFQLEINKSTISAATAVDPKRENQLLDEINYYECAIRHVNKKFSYENSLWVNPKCTQVLSIIEDYTNATTQQLYNAANRKSKKDQFRDAAKDLIDLALIQEPENLAFLKLRYTLTNEVDDQDRIVAAILQIDVTNSFAMHAIRDKNDWIAAESIDSKESYDRYLSKWPDGRFFTQANELRELRAKEDAEATHESILIKAIRIKGSQAYAAYPDNYNRSNPSNTVEINSDLSVSKKLITAQQFEKFINALLAKGYSGESILQKYFYAKDEDGWSIDQITYDQAQNQFKTQSNHINKPAIVTWFGAYDYCKFYGGRLLRPEEYVTLIHLAFGEQLKNGKYKIKANDIHSYVVMKRKKNDYIQFEEVASKLPDKLGFYDLFGLARNHLQQARKYVKVKGADNDKIYWHEFDDNSTTLSLDSQIIPSDYSTRMAGYPYWEELNILFYESLNWYISPDVINMFTGFRIAFE